MKASLVSICIPTYNGALYLNEALESVKNQTYKSIEVIVSDDESKDSTLTMVRDFKDTVDFPVTILSHQPNGIGANWNNSIKHAKGKYIKFLFQDDVLETTCVEEMVSVFLQNPKLKLVGCKRQFIVEGHHTEKIAQWIKVYGNLQIQFEKDEHITFMDNSIFAREDFLQNPKNKIGEPPTVMFKRSILNEVGFFDETLKQTLDYVFYYKILKNHPIAIINKPLVKFRIHDAQATNVNRTKSIDDYKIYTEMLYKEFFPYLHSKNKKKLVLKFSKTARFKNNLKNVFRKFRS